MAQLQSVFLVFTKTLALVISLHHVSSLVSPASTSTVTMLSKHNNVTDRKSLLAFKDTMSGAPRESVVFWNDSTHFCQWLGVTCSGRWHPQRVISLNLRSLDLGGFISPAIANLTFLRTLDLSNNQFHGPIPQEIGRLSRLQHLNLSFNSLDGGIPATLSQCSKLNVITLADNMLQGELPPGLCNCLDLQIIRLSNNSLTGSIPSSFSNLSSLSVLSLCQNQLTGQIPPAMGNLHSLNELDLFENKLSGGIPSSLCKLSKLETLLLYSNNLSGGIPTSLWNLSSLFSLDLSENHLSGVLPPNAGQALSLLEYFILFDNQLHGSVPMSIFSNSSHLKYIQLHINRFSRMIPADLGSLQNLRFLTLAQNQLENKEPDGFNFLTILINCTKLEVLQLDFNNLEGVLPNSVANLSANLRLLTMGNNFISGNIPSNIGNLVSLTILDLGPNILTGSIPDSIGMLQNLHVLDLSRNKLSGEISSTVDNLTNLVNLYLGDNELSGIIPANLGNCHYLISLDLGSNKFTGAIPREILRIPTLSIILRLANNSLTGVIPSEVGSLRNLGIIDFSFNKLSGQIPSTFAECKVLEEIHLHGNFFQGSIPSSLVSLRGIRLLDFSQNKLSGRIPDFLQGFHDLYSLNLSFNNFGGEVPRGGVFENVSAVSIVGNNKLCGGNPEMHLPACPSQSTNKNHGSHSLLLIISISISFLLLFVFFCLLAARCWVQKSRRKPQASTLRNEQNVRVSYAKLVRATDGFSTANLVGMGSFGSVYKGILDDDDDDDDDAGVQVVAVKVLNLQLRGASKSFISECEALRNIRHRNLVKIITVCSSVDFRGNDFKAVVFEFMPNGSLDDWLHHNENQQGEQKKLSLIQRLNIAIDAASALDYLHCQCETPIVHCDLKPSNILLDGDMTAHVGDFGLAKFVKETVSKSSLGSTSSIGLKGTVGYIAPEYGVANKVSVHGDVYSYGILLLEMFTGKRPTDDMFKEGQSLRQFVESAFSERIMGVIDARLFVEEEEEEEASEDAYSSNASRIMECVASVFRVGLLCSNELPADRMEMIEIVNELVKIRDVFSKNETQGEMQTRAQ